MWGPQGRLSLRSGMNGICQANGSGGGHPWQENWRKQRPRGVEKVVGLQRRLKMCLDTVGDGLGPSMPLEGRPQCRAMEISEELEVPMTRMDSCSCVWTVGDEAGR